MKLLILLLFVGSVFTASKPAKHAKVIIEDITLRKQVGYQEAGEKGKVGFAYLNQGKYRLIVEFPQQEGKWIKEKQNQSTLAKATFNEKNKTYYYQGREGYFSIHFEGVKKIDKEQFKAVFQELSGERENQMVIAEFQSRKDGAKLEMTVKALTAKKYKRATDKLGSDISTISIPGQK